MGLAFNLLVVLFALNASVYTSLRVRSQLARLLHTLADELQVASPMLELAELQKCYVRVVETADKNNSSSQWKNWARLLPTLMVMSVNSEHGQEKDANNTTASNSGNVESNHSTIDGRNFYASVNHTLFSLAMEEWSQFHLDVGLGSALDACDCVADIGGGSGVFLAGLKSRRRILLDASKEALSRSRIEERHTANMFDAETLKPIAGCSCVMLKGIVSDYDEHRVRQLLSNIHHNMDNSARLYLFDHFLLGSSPHWDDMEAFRLGMDLMMRRLLGARQYSLDEIARIAHGAGFRFVGMEKTKQSPVVVVEMQKMIY